MGRLACRIQLDSQDRPRHSGFIWLTHEIDIDLVMELPSGLDWSRHAKD